MSTRCRHRPWFGRTLEEAWTRDVRPAEPRKSMTPVYDADGNLIAYETALCCAPEQAAYITRLGKAEG